jgi:outer membrane protein assembly factor BamB
MYRLKHMLNFRLRCVLVGEQSVLQGELKVTFTVVLLGGNMRKQVALVVLLSLLAVQFCTVFLSPHASANPITTTDDWPMFHHDPAHSGTTTSSPVKPVQLWNYTNGHSAQQSYGFESSPAVVNGKVYVAYPWDGIVFAFDAFSGTKMWNFTTGGRIYSSPAVSENIVYIGSGDNNVYALDASTGDQIWNYTTGSVVGSSPTVVNKIVYIGSSDHNVYALNASDGRKIWNFTTQDDVVSSPAVTNGVVYVGDFSYYSEGAFYALNASTGTKIWSSITDGAMISSPTVSNGMVYVGSVGGYLYAFDAISGYQVWNFSTYTPRIYAGGYYWGITSTPAVADGVVYAISTWHANTFALNASTGEKIWFVDGGGFSSPAVADGVVYIDSRALNASDGALIWGFPTEGVNSSPALVDGVLYFADRNGNFFAVGEPSTTPTPSPSIPEFPAFIAVPLLLATTLGILLFQKKFFKARE